MAAVMSAVVVAAGSAYAAKGQARAAAAEPYAAIGRRATEPSATPDAKCPCCGSRSFTVRNDARICLYCRSEQ